jgi:hypothetical protein
MQKLKAFFTKKLLLTCLVADIIISLVFSFKFVSTHHTSFANAFAVFFITNYVVLLLIFFVLYMIGNREKG